MRGPRWITEAEVEGGVIPEGGTTDQVLAKQSDANYDLKWATAGGGGGGFLHQSEALTLTDSQIKALPTTAVEIVPAQGENTIIIPQFAWFYLTWADDYGNIGDGGWLGLAYSTPAANPLVNFEEPASGEVSNLLADGASHPAYLGVRTHPYDSGGGALHASGIGQFEDDPGTINVGLVVKASNSGSHTGNYSGGDTGNALQVSVAYLVWDISTGQFI